MSKAETDVEIAKKQFVEKYIRELNWHPSTSDEIRTYVAGNLRAFWSRVEGSNTELRKRYNEARALLTRCTNAYYRDGHEESETIDEAMGEALSWVSQEELEDEVFGEAAAVQSDTSKETL